MKQHDPVTAVKVRYAVNTSETISYLQATCVALLVFLLCFTGVGTRAQDTTVVDNSTSPCFPPFKNQGKVASCDWFACVYYQMTYLKNRQLGKAYNETTTFSPKFAFTLVNNGNMFPDNLWFADVYAFLERHGSPTLSDMEYDLAEGEHYKEWCVDSAVWRRAINNRIKGCESLPFDMRKVKELLRDGEVLVTQLNPFTAQYLRSKDNPLTPQDDAYVGDYVISSGANGPDHTVCVVGYNDNIWIDRNGNNVVEAGELGALRIAESYVDEHVNNGFRWLSYACVTNPASTLLFGNLVWRMILREEHKPTVLVQVTLRHAERGNLKFQFGRAESPTAESARESALVFDPVALGFTPGASGKSLIEGANYSFDGTVGAHDGSFTFDLTDIGAAGGKNYGSILIRCWSDNFYLSNKSIVKNHLLVPVGGFEPVDYRASVGSF